MIAVTRESSPETQDESARLRQLALRVALGTASPDDVDKFCRCCADCVSSYVHRRITDIHAAEDLTQEAVLSVFRTGVLSTLGSDKEVAYYLSGIARNMVAKHFRTTRRTRTGIDEASLPASPERDTHSAAVSTEVAIVFKEEVAKLTDTCRVPFVLHYYEGLSVAEIAEHLNLAYATVTQRLCRGRTALAEGLVQRGVAVFEPESAETPLGRVTIDGNGRASFSGKRPRAKKAAKVLKLLSLFILTALATVAG